MPIQLFLTNGSPLAKIIADQTVDSSQASITFIGKGWIGGGADIWNQNLLGMLENFAGPGYPNHPLIGQLWYDSNRQGIRVHVGLGAPDGDENGWSSVLTTLDYVDQNLLLLSNTINNLGYTTPDTSLVFDDPSSDIVIPASGTLANPPALILNNVNTGWPAGDAAGDPQGPPAAATGSTYTNLVVNTKGLVLAARALTAADLAAIGGTSAIALSGDVSGSGAITSPITLTLATVNNNIGTFNTVVVNRKGLVTAASMIPYIQNVVVSGDVSGSSTGNLLTLALASVNASPGTYNTIIVNAKGLVTSGSNTAYLTGLSGLTASGDVSGTSTGNNIVLTLASVNSNIGTFNTLSVNAKGLVTAAANTPYLTGLSVAGDVSGASSGSSLTLTLASVNANTGTFNTLSVNAKGLVTAASNTPYLTGLSVSGDVSGTSSGSTLALTLANVNSNTGTFNTVTVNAKGLVTSASNADYILWTLPAFSRSTSFGPNAPASPGGSSSPATGTWVCPSNTYFVRATVCGAGGGGGGSTSNSSSGGGGAGGIIIGVLAVTPGTSYAYSVGAGGAGGQANSSGAAGQSSSFAGVLTAYGGTGGSASGPGGSGGNTAFNASLGYPLLFASGGFGTSGNAYSLTGVAGSGGASYFGGGGRGGLDGDAGQDSQTYGAGGGGCYYTVNVGGYGAGGLIILEW